MTEYRITVKDSVFLVQEKKSQGWHTLIETRNRPYAVRLFDRLTTSITNSSTLLKDIEKDVILNSYMLNNKNKTHTARALGIGIRTLQRKLKRYERESYW